MYYPWYCFTREFPLKVPFYRLSLNREIRFKGADGPIEIASLYSEEALQIGQRLHSPHERYGSFSFVWESHGRTEFGQNIEFLNWVYY